MQYLFESFTSLLVGRVIEAPQPTPNHPLVLLCTELCLVNSYYFVRGTQGSDQVVEHDPSGS